MKRILYLLIAVLLVIVIVLFLFPYPTRFVIAPIKQALEHEITARSDFKLTIGTIRFLFLNRITVESVSIYEKKDESEDAIFSAERATIYFNIVSLFINKDRPIQAITKIRLNRFDCSAVGFPDVSSGSTDLPIPDIHFENGIIRFAFQDNKQNAQQQTIPIELSIEEGYVKTISENMALHIKGSVKRVGRFSLSAFTGPAGDWQATLTSTVQSVRPADLHPLKAVGITEIQQYCDRIVFRGNASVTVECSGEFDEQFSVSDWTIHMTISSSTVNGILLTNDTIDTVNADISLSKSKLEIHHATILLPNKTECFLRGTIDHPFTARLYNIDYRLANINLNDADPWLSPLSNNDMVRLKGSIAGQITGHQNNPTVRLDIPNVRIRVGPYLSGDLSMNAIYQDSTVRIFNIFIRTPGGIIRGESQGSKTMWEGTFSTEELNLASLLPPEIPSFVSGILAGSLNVSSVDRSLSMEGKWFVRNFVLLDQPQPDVSCVVHVKDKRLTLDAKTASNEFVFSADCRKFDDRVQLSQMIVNSKSVDLEANGVLMNSDKNIDLSVKLHTLPVAMLERIHPIARQLQGFLKFYGSIKGSLSAPRIIGRCSASDDTGEYFSSEISADIHEVRLLNMVFLEQMTGEIRWMIPTDEYVITLSEDELELASFAHQLSMNPRISGKISGTQHYERVMLPALDASRYNQSFLGTMGTKLQKLFAPKDAAKRKTHIWKGTSQLSITDGRCFGMPFKNMKFNCSLDADAITIHNLSIEQSDGNLIGSGTISRTTNNNNISLSLNCKHLAWNSLYGDGQITVRGDYESFNAFTATIHSPSFWLQGTRIGQLEGGLAYRDNRLVFDKWEFGKFIKTDLSLDFNQIPGLLNGFIEAYVED
ncbi:MAG: hypothetical protein GF384_03695, partial [Elusimicrobia bacterium]|nr:hypothetical protein [Elusimicrobiota bacterium]MBD3412014.1 hypothetical protein [Elusimicrobiota bacterium]